MEALAEAGYRAFAFDQRGYSPRARPSDVEDYGVDSLVADALAVVGTQGWESFDVVGHDWGAMVAWALAAWHPGRISTLSAVSVPHPGALAAALSGGDDDQARRSAYVGVFRAEGGVAEKALLGEDTSGDGLRAMFSASGLSPEHAEVEVFVAAMLEPGALTAALNWYRAMNAETLSAVGPVSVPTLFVWSTSDIALGRRAAEATADWVTGAYKFCVLEGVSHWIPETAPEQLSVHLIEHLKAHG